MLELLKPTVDFVPVYAAKLVADIPDEKLTAQPVPGIHINHAAWNLGHLAWAFDNGIGMLGGTRLLEAWKPTVGQGSTPVADRAAYPAKEELLRALTDAKDRILQTIATTKPEILSAPSPERIRHIFPTMGSGIAGLISTHQGNHLGRLCTWRRAMGYKNSFF